MKQNNNISVLPFYTDVYLQNHRLSYAYGRISPLLTPLNIIPPFQIITAQTEPFQPYNARLMDKDGIFVKDITTQMEETGLHIVNRAIGGYNVIVYTGIIPIAENLTDGTYYLEFTYGAEKYYSDMFCMMSDSSDLLKIEWYDIEDFLMGNGTGIIYNNPKYHNRLYFCAEIGKPSYTFAEDVEKRDGYVFPIKQISEKTYKFVILATEYLLDVMRFIRMSDFVRITDKYGRIYDCDTFLMTPTWQKMGDLASVEIEFTTDTIAKKNGGGYIQETKGDFNEDYLNDFNN